MSKNESQAGPEATSGNESEATQENSNTQVQTAEAAAKEQQDLRDLASFKLRQGKKLEDKDLVKMSDDTCLSLATELLHEDKSIPAILARACPKNELRTLRADYKQKLRGVSAAWVAHMHELGFKMEKRSQVNPLKNGDENVTIKLVKKATRVVSQADIIATVSKMKPEQVEQIKKALAKLRIEAPNDDAIDVPSEQKPPQIAEKSIA